MAIAAVIYILYKRASGMPPHKRRAEYIKLGLGVAVVGVVMLTLAGKMHWIGAALTGLLVAARQLAPSLIRLFPMLASMRSKSAPSAGQNSTVESAILRMQLDHDSGDLQGEVLQGQFKGWRLADLDRDQLQTLLHYCESEDQDSLALLDSYIQQRYPKDSNFNHKPAHPSSSDMPRTEALAVLGLGEDADNEAIIAAHRSLIQKLHPDRGGNDYLAAKINQAKDQLLG